MGMTTTGIGSTSTALAITPDLTPLYSLDFEHSLDAGLEMSAANFGTASMSNTKRAFSFWVRFEDLSPEASNWAVFDQGITTVTTDCRFIHHVSSSTYRFQGRFNTSGLLVFQIADTAIPINTWTHVYAIIDSTQATESNRMKVYINGTEATYAVAPTYPAQNETIVISSGTGNFRIGGNETDAWDMDGLLFQFAVFDGGLGALPDISDLYNSGSPKDVSQIASLHSLLLDSSDNSTSADVTKDYVLSADWSTSGTTFTSGPVASATVPS